MSVKARTMWQIRCDIVGCWQGYPSQPTEVLWGGAPALRADAERDGWWFDLDLGDRCPKHAPPTPPPTPSPEPRVTEENE